MKTNDLKCLRLRDFITANAPSRIDTMVSNIEQIVSTLLQDVHTDAETTVFMLRQLDAIKADYRELRELSVLFNNDKAA